MPPVVNLETAGIRQSSRMRTKSVTQEADQTKEITSLSQFRFFSHHGGDRLVAALAINYAGYRSLSMSPNLSFFSQSIKRFHHLNAHYDGTFNVLSTFAYAAINDSVDKYTLKEILKQADVANFVEAMIKDVNNHETLGHWICVPRSSIPAGTKTILAIWSFNRKLGPSQNGKHASVAMEVCKSWGSTTGKHMPQ